MPFLTDFKQGRNLPKYETVMEFEDSVMLILLNDIC